MVQNRSLGAENLPVCWAGPGQCNVAMGKNMTNRILYNLVANTSDLASLPSTVVDLLYLFRDEDASAESVMKVLNGDPAMTANVLKMSNSAFYGARGSA